MKSQKIDKMFLTMAEIEQRRYKRYQALRSISLVVTFTIIVAITRYIMESPK